LHKRESARDDWPADRALRSGKLLAEGVFLTEVGGLPGINLCLGVIHRGERLFVADGGDPLIDSFFIRSLHLVQIGDFDGMVHLFYPRHDCRYVKRRCKPLRKREMRCQKTDQQGGRRSAV
jgi:hypothetical protein